MLTHDDILRVVVAAAMDLESDELWAIVDEFETAERAYRDSPDVYNRSTLVDCAVELRNAYKENSR